MGSFYMSGSYSHEVILPNSDCFWMIAASYYDNDREIVIPLSLPMFCKYFDYGEMHDFIKNQVVVSDVLKWFETSLPIHDFNEKYYDIFYNERDFDPEWAKKMQDKLIDLVRSKHKLDPHTKRCIKSLHFCLLYDYKWVWDAMTGPGEHEYDICIDTRGLEYREYNSEGNYDVITKELLFAIHRYYDNIELATLKKGFDQWLYNSVIGSNEMSRHIRPSHCANNRIIYCLKEYHKKAYEFYNNR